MLSGRVHNRQSATTSSGNRCPSPARGVTIRTPRRKASSCPRVTNPKRILEGKGRLPGTQPRWLRRLLSYADAVEVVNASARVALLELHFQTSAVVGGNWTPTAVEQRHGAFNYVTYSLHRWPADGEWLLAAGRFAGGRPCGTGAPAMTASGKPL